jgi:RNA polymerase sigma factor (sigma-70 family)
MPADEPGEFTDTLVRRAIERLQRGDPAAKNDLLSYAQQQLGRMVRKMLYEGSGYAVVRRWEQTDDVIQGSLIRLSRTIDTLPINSPRDFFKLAATNIRWELKTLRDKYLAGSSPAHRHHTDMASRRDPGRTPFDRALADKPAPPDSFAEMSRFLDAIETLTDEDREILDLRLVHGLARQEAADHLGLSLGTFKRRYADACDRLGERLGDPRHDDTPDLPQSG